MNLKLACLFLACFWVASCDKENTHKKDTREILYLPHMVHKKNVNIALDSAFLDFFKNLRYGVGGDEADTNGVRYSYTGDKKSYFENVEYVKKVLKLEELFGYRETAVLAYADTRRWFSIKMPAQQPLRKHHKWVWYNLCFRALEKKQGKCYFVERHYIFSCFDNVVKDIIAFDIPPSHTKMLSALVTPEYLYWEEGKLEDKRVIEILYYLNTPLSECRVSFTFPYNYYPLAFYVKGIKVIQKVIYAIDTLGNFDTNPRINVKPLQPEFFYGALPDSTRQKLYNIIEYPSK